jgi:hypothetical protein
MSIRNDLKRSIVFFLKTHRGGSYSTQADRRYILLQAANDLVSLGYGLRDINGLKQKHVLAIVKSWQDKGLSNSTIKNRTAVLRKLCEGLKKSTLVPNNDQLKIGKRKYVSVTNRAQHNPNFEKISDPYIKISLELQRVFGLRREESLKIKPHLADKGNRLELFPTWCKGGRGRTLLIRTNEQRYWLEQAKILAGKFGNSLIPQKKNYFQQRCLYDKQVNRAGLRNLHGLRHAYAQSRYKELTGWEAPINGGPKSRELSKEQKQIDYKARMILTEELGHSREAITVNYLSR